MFAYFSLLVEIGTFDIIEVNFLIVGHTHCSIDQYFSILSRGIRRCEFIGSPIALWNLYQGVHKNPKRRPSVNRQIDTIFDMKVALQPYLNPCKNFKCLTVFYFVRSSPSAFYNTSYFHSTKFISQSNRP